MDEDGSRYLLGDIVGHLYLLVLNHDRKRVLGLKLQSLGRTSAPSSISYLDNAVVFVGSSGGDSQLIRCGAAHTHQPVHLILADCLHIRLFTHAWAAVGVAFSYKCFCSAK